MVITHRPPYTTREGCLVKRPVEFSRFEFAVLSGLRVAQLIRGCTPRVVSSHKKIMTAQIEVAAGKVVRAADQV
jgi:DNA-directed RNA polymerase subunit K/omega